jgi:hypothetical protein
MVEKIADHMDSSDPHGSVGPADSVNADIIRQLSSAPVTPEGYASTARILAQRLLNHMANGDGSETWHISPDWENTLIIEPPTRSNMANVMATFSDIYRAYEAHRLKESPVHLAEDTDNDLTVALNPLLNLHNTFLSSMRPLLPSAPAGMNRATVELAALGFRRGVT